MDNTVIVFSIFAIFITVCTCQGLNCGSNKLPCGEKVAQCYDASQQCDGNKDCGTGKDEENCTATAVTKHLIVNHYDEADDNFAWLVTPIIFGIGCINATYKCLKEGFCTIQRLGRDAAAHEHSSAGGRHYFVLDRWSFHSLTRIPTSRLGTTANICGSTHRQLVLVTNHSFSISLSDMQEGRSPNSERSIHSMLPPTYNEVVDPQGSRHDIGVNNNGFIPLSREIFLMEPAAIERNDPDLPSYSEAIDPLIREDSCNSTTHLNSNSKTLESEL